ncbi:MAG: PEGA domain-containing protein [Patescibacteria group bacterium]
MRKLRIILLVVLGIGFVVGLALFLIGYFRPKEASLNIETTPASLVYINGQQVGRTPYRSNISPGEVVVKLVPEATDTALTPFETKVNLVSGIETVIRREFGETEDTSSGEIISFEKIGGKEASLAVVSVPNNAQVSIDGVKRGFAPVKNTVTPGEHQIIVSAPGFTERVLSSIQTLIGYKLTAVVKLASTGESRKEEAPKEEKQTLVEILSTDTGFLRVREKPGPAGAEVAQVKPGQRFLFLEEDAESGWYKIEYLPAQAGEAGKEGWVSNTYSKKVEGVLSSPSP